MPVAGQQVDALERVVRVADDRLGLLDPVERRPLHDDPAAEVGVVRGEPGGRDGAVTDDEVEPLPGGWCHSKCTGPSTGGSPSGTSAAGHGTSDAKRSARGTAYIGTTRRGSQTNTASVVSSTGTPPSEARTRRVTGSYRSSPRRLSGADPGASPSPMLRPLRTGVNAGRGRRGAQPAVRPCRDERAPRRTRLVRGRTRPLAAALLRRRGLDLAHHHAALTDGRRLDDRAGHPGRHPRPRRQPGRLGAALRAAPGAAGPGPVAGRGDAARRLQPLPAGLGRAPWRRAARRCRARGVVAAAGGPHPRHHRDHRDHAGAGHPVARHGLLGDVGLPAAGAGGRRVRGSAPTRPPSPSRSCRCRCRSR